MTGVQTCALPIPLVVWLTMTIGKQVKELKKRENRAYEQFQGGLTEVLEAIYQIRAANRENYYIQGLIGDARSLRDHSTRFEWRSEAANRFSFMVFLVGFDMFRALSMGMVVFSDLSIGQMMAVFGYLWFMMGPVQEVLGIQYALYGAKAALQRINRLVDLDEEPDYPHLKNPFKGRTSVAIELQDIHFSYIDGQEILRGLSLKIDAGQKIALVGASGGGKSTLVQIILGLYPADSGNLYVDGVNLREIGLDVVRENVATVLQNPAMFNDTVRENLCLGRNHDDATIWQALEIAQLQKVVEKMPLGLDAVIGRSGIRLSGGQRQRLAIARMILADPKVVILDEATSSLDTETEALLHEAMHEFLQNRTTLIIAHRLSAVKQADRVLVFDAGKIIDEGHHHELINKDGLYRDLYGNRS